MANDDKIPFDPQPAAPEENIIISVLKKQRARYERLIVEAEALGSDVAPVVELIRKDIARTDAAIAEADSLDRLRKENAELRNERDEARQGWAERNHQIMNMARALNCTVDVVSEKVALLTAERDTAQARARKVEGERDEAQNRCADANVELAWAKESIASLQSSLAAAEARAREFAEIAFSHATKYATADNDGWMKVTDVLHVTWQDGASAADYLHSLGILERHPEKPWYRFKEQGK